MYFYDGKDLIVSDKELKDNALKVNYEFNEKHTPSFEIVGDKLLVNVNHGMSEEHYITTIVYKYENGYDVVRLNANDEPNWEFEYKGNGEIFEHCNLHGIFAIKM